jgi:hypothetical protein
MPFDLLHVSPLRFLVISRALPLLVLPVITDVPFLYGVSRVPFQLLCSERREAKYAEWRITLEDYYIQTVISHLFRVHGCC